MPHAHSWVTGPALAVLLAAGSVAAAGSAKGAPPTATPGQALAQGLAAWLSPQALPQDVVSAAVDTVGPQPHTVAALNPGGRLTPGSLAALFSSAAELALLGPGHRLSTQVWIGGRLRHGTVEGNLYLLGQGDPTLTDRSFAQMAAQVAGRIHRVTGALVVDASLLGPPSAPPGWTAQVEETSALPAALAMDQGLATVTLRPGKVGQPVQVSVLPRGALQVQDLATTALHPAQPLAMRVLAGSRLLTVTGGLAPKAKAVVQEVPEASPALVAAGAFLADLRADGVQVAGGVREGHVPRGARLITAHTSASLSALIQEQYRTASPFIAECLLRVLGSPAPAGEATGAYGIQRVLRFLSAWHSRPAPVLDDGSGRSLEDQAAAGNLAALLARAYAEPWGQPLVRAVAAASAGTTTPVAGGSSVTALTAQGPGWAGLAGWVIPPKGPRLAFAVLVNGGVGRTVLARLDLIRTGLAQWPGPFHGPPFAPPFPRVPAPLPPPAWTRGLRQALDGAGPGSTVAVDLISTSSGQVLWARDADLPLGAPGIVPMLVGAVARLQLDPTATLVTRLLMDGSLKGRTVDGQLVLVGAADPTLSLANLQSLAGHVADLGIRAVTGGIGVYDPGTGPAAFGPQWPVENDTAPTQPPIDSLSVGGDQVTVAVLPGARPGQPPSAVVVPLASGLSVRDLATTVPGRADTLRLTWDPGQPQFVLSGTLGLKNSTGAVFLRTAPDPALLAGHLLAAALKAAGVAVNGGVARLAAPPAHLAVVAQTASAPLSTLTQQMLAAPSALTAEDLLSLMGASAGSAVAPGPPALGLARLERLLGRFTRGSPPPALSDGAGLALTDRLAPATVVAALLHLPATPALAQLPELLPLVPTGPGAGSVHGVMGIGPGAAALAGYVTTTSGAQLAVSIQLGHLTLSPTAAQRLLTVVAGALRTLPLVGVGVGSQGGHPAHRHRSSPATRGASAAPQTPARHGASPRPRGPR